MDILLIDDHPMFSDGVSLVLKGMDPDISIVQKQDFTGGFEYLNEVGDLDLVLMDLHLPDVTELSGIETIRKEHPTIPLVVLTGHEDRDTVNQCIQLGVQGYILKSSTTEMLLHALKLILSGGEYFPRIAFGSDKVDAHSLVSADTSQSESNQSVMHQLTERELEVLTLLTVGKSNKEIARDLDISDGTVKIHVAAILKKLDVANRTSAVMAATKLGLV